MTMLEEIIIWGAIKKSKILIMLYWKNAQFDRVPKNIIVHLGSINTCTMLTYLKARLVTSTHVFKLEATLARIPFTTDLNNFYNDISFVSVFYITIFMTAFLWGRIYDGIFYGVFIMTVFFLWIFSFSVFNKAI